MRRIVAAALLVVLVVAAALLLGSWLVDARMEDAERLVRAVSDDESDPANLGIVVRFELISRRLQVGEDRVESYELEAKMQSLLSGARVSAPVRQSSRPAARAARAAFRLARRLAGRADPPPAAPAALTALEEAYLWERARRYRRALESYDRLLAEEPGLPPRIRERVHLHRAFCLAMSGDTPGGRAVCGQLAADALLQETAWVARQMQRFIARIQMSQADVDRDRPQRVDVGRDLYLAMDYAGAAEVLRSFLQRRTGDPRSGEARYYLARALEELGGDAVEEYRRVMMLDPGSRWARDANRRLVMIGAFYGGSAEIGEGATRRLVRMGDQVFVDAVEPYRELVSPDPALAGLMRASAQQRAVDRGELFVQTTPAGAQVSVNGVEVGTSPVFVTDVPFGRSLVRAVTGPHSGELAVDVYQPDIIRVVLTLAAPTGSIAVETSLNGVEVFVDEARAAAVDLFAVIPGRHVVVVRALDEAGRIRYWEKEVEVEAGATTVVRVP